MSSSSPPPHEADESAPAVGERLEWLIAHIRDPDTTQFFTANALARKAGVTDTTVSRVCRGDTRNSRPKTLDKLAAAFGLPPTIFHHAPKINAIWTLALSGDPRGQQMIEQMQSLQAAQALGMVATAGRLERIQRSNPDAYAAIMTLIKMAESSSTDPSDDQ